MSKGFHRIRRTVGGALLLALIALPFINIGGESAFRFDVPSLRLLFFGAAIWMEDFFIVLIAAIFLTFLIMFITTVFGRVWCGWLCPQTVLVDSTEFFVSGRKKGFFSMVLSGLLSALIAFSLTGYFVSPYDLPGLLQQGGLPARILIGSWTVLTILVFLDAVLLGRRFCATACPYAKIQGVLFDERTLRIAFDPRRSDDCMHCDACVRACPVDIDIRNGLQSSCVQCAECVDACVRQMGGKGRSSLINYFFGLPGTAASGLRVNPLLTGLITAGFLVFLVYLVVSQQPFEASLRPQKTLMANLQPDNSITNTYVLTLRNRKKVDLELALVVRSFEGTAALSLQRVLVKHDEGRKDIPLTVTLQGLPATTIGMHRVSLSIRSEQENITVTKQLTMIVPNRKKDELP